MLTPNQKLYIPDVYTHDLTDMISAFDAGIGGPFTTATLVGGSAVITDANIKTTSRIQYQRSTAGGTLGHLSYSISNGVSFTLTSSSGTDTSTILYKITY